MPTGYTLVVKNHDGRPLQGVPVIPVNAATNAEGTAVVTDDFGLVTFTGLADAVYGFRTNLKRVGDCTFFVVNVIHDHSGNEEGGALPAGTVFAGLTAGRVPFASAGPVLVDDDDLTYVTATRQLHVGTAGAGSPGLFIGSANLASGEGVEFTYEYANDRWRLTSIERGVAYRGGTIEGSDLVISAGSGSVTQAVEVDVNRNVNIGTGAAALATNATNGFLYIPTCAGTPTGVPTTKTGSAPIVYDSTNNVFYVYDGAWIGVGVA